MTFHRAIRILAMFAMVGVICTGPLVMGQARADRIARLADTLLHADNAKKRISAAVSLSRRSDVRAVDALITALGDDDRSVRAIAAVGLGKQGDRRALPALRKATEDSDEQVRKRVDEAIQAIEANSPYPISRGKGEPGFGQNPRALIKPRIHVVIGSAADDLGSASKAARSKGSERTASKSDRKQLAAAMRRMFQARLDDTPEITTSKRVARKLGVPRYSLDASIIRLGHEQKGSIVEVECQIRVAVSDHRGKMLSFLSGSARVKVPSSSFDASQLTELWREALDSAIKSVHSDLLDYLVRRTG